MSDLKNDLWFERVALGEIEPGALTDEERRRVEAIAASNETILTHLPPAGVKTEVERRLASTPRAKSRWRWGLGLVPVVAAAATLLVVSNEGPTERTKGDARLVVHAKSAEGVVQVREDDALDRGVLLQVGYTPGGAGYGAVVSIDGRGVVTLHWPTSPSAWSPPIEPDGGTLPSAYELDDAPRFERFFFVQCPERFAAKSVVAAVEVLARSDAATGKLEVDDGCRTDALLLKKRSGVSP